MDRCPREQTIEIKIPEGAFGGGRGLSLGDVKDLLYDEFWICPRCGGVYSRKVMNGRYVCKHCWTEEDQIALDAKKEDVRKQLQEMQEEIEEYHRNKNKGK